MDRREGTIRCSFRILVVQRISRKKVVQTAEHREPDPRGLGSCICSTDEFNRSTLDDVGPVGGEQGMRVLHKMNSLVDDHDDFAHNPSIV
jgi:hypothetical protein